MNVLPFQGKVDNFGVVRESLNNYLNPSNGGVLWSILKADAPARITPDLLKELIEVQQDLLYRYSHNQVGRAGDNVSYHILSSEGPDIFSLGGDLAFFAQCVKQGDRKSLTKYARDAIEFVYQSSTNYHLPVTTITVVKGAAFGGGFEAALAANYIIAEEQATFSFPETRFGLFPGMGAFTFLRQRVPVHVAEEIIYSGKLYTATELLQMNVIDRVCKTGAGYKTAMQFISSRQHQHQGIQAMRKMAQQFAPIDKQELYSIVDYWVESVFSLDKKNLRLIEALSKTRLNTHPGRRRVVDATY